MSSQATRGGEEKGEMYRFGSLLQKLMLGKQAVGYKRRIFTSRFDLSRQQKRKV